MVILTFEREIWPGAVVNCDRYNEAGLIPYDRLTFLPIVPFRGIAVED